MRLKGQIQFSKPNTNYRENNFMIITVTDSNSRTQFVEIEIPLEAFANALLVGMNTECELDVRGLNKVGVIRERKTEQVPVSFSSYDSLTVEVIEKTLAPFEVDGWIGSQTDFRNSKNYDYKNNTCNVTFTRYINKEDE